MNSVIAKIADTIFCYRIALLTLCIIFLLNIHMNNHLTLVKSYDL